MLHDQIMFIHISSVNTSPFKGGSQDLKSVMFTSDYTRISSDGGSSAGRRPCLTPTQCTAGVARQGVAAAMKDTPRFCSRCGSCVGCGGV